MKIFHMNTQKPLNSCWDRIQQFVHDNKVDVFCITETQFANFEEPIEFESFDLYYQNKYRQVVYVKRNIGLQFIRFEAETPAIWIRGRETDILFVYGEHSDGVTFNIPINIRKDRLVNTIGNFLSRAYSKALVIGDTNLNIFKINDDNNIKEFVNYLHNRDFVNEITEATRITYIPGQEDSLIDHAWQRGLKCKVNVHNLGFSDHLGILVDLFKNKTESIRYKNITFFNCSEGLRDVMMDDSHDINWDFRKRENATLQEIYDATTEYLQKIKNLGTKTIKVPINGVPWFGPELRYLQSVLNRLKGQERKEFRKYYNIRFNLFRKSYFIKQAKKGKIFPKRQREPMEKLIDEQGVECTDPKSMCDIMGDHFKKKADNFVTNSRPDYEHILDNMRDRVSSSLEEGKFNENWGIPVPSLNIVERLIKGLEPTGAAAEDGISFKVLKGACDFVIENVHCMFKKVLLNPEILEVFLNHITVCIHKPGKDKYSKLSWRPIVTNNWFFRILTKYLYGILAIQIERIGFFEGLPLHGFRLGYGTGTAVTDLMRKLVKARDSYPYTGICLYDLKGAYESAPKLMIRKILEILRPENKVLALFEQFFKPRKFKIRINGEYGSDFELKHGLSQGDPLSCLFFVLVTSALPEFVHCQGMVIYADDAAVIYGADSLLKYRNAVKNGSRQFSKYSRNCGFEVEVDKTEHVLFNKNPKLKIPAEFTILDKKIKTTKEMTYLGTKFDSRLNFQSQTEYLVGKIRYAGIQLKRAVLGIPKKFRPQIIHGYLYSRIRYNLDSYVEFLSKNQLDQIEHAMNAAIKKTFGILKFERICMSEFRSKWKLPSVFQLARNMLEKEAFLKEELFRNELEEAVRPNTRLKSKGLIIRRFDFKRKSGLYWQQKIFRAHKLYLFKGTKELRKFQKRRENKEFSLQLHFGRTPFKNRFRENYEHRSICRLRDIRRNVPFDNG